VSDWNPEQYLAFADERARPCIDLVLRIPVQRPRLVYDLGCGPGNSTAILQHAYPSARMIGIDRSPAMISKAKQSVAGAEFRSQDVALWPGDQEADLIFANALFQWVPQHVNVLQRILQPLKKEAVLAVQMPDNLYEPSHVAMANVAEWGPWAHKLTKAKDTRSEILEATEYYDMLKPQCSHLEIWHTLYQHAVDGYDAVIAMFVSTGLKPYIDPLSESERTEFLAAYKTELRKHYPLQADGKVLFRFPRLFIVAKK
jgi:trans-aconitate 2-methyltransferase